LFLLIQVSVSGACAALSQRPVTGFDFFDSMFSVVNSQAAFGSAACVVHNRNVIT